MSLFIVALVQLLLVLGSEAKIYAWGVNDYGQLGLNNTVTMYYKYPQAIPMYNNVDIVDVKASGTFHMATAANGDVYVCGNNWYGALMVPPSEHIFISFPTINSDLKNCKIYLGRRHGNAVCGSKFYGWGASAGLVAGITGGIYGKKMESLSQYGIGDNVASVVAGSGFAIVTMQNGTVFSVGKGESGELGLGDTKEKLAFTKLTFVDMIPFKTIFPSHADHVCAITANYNLYCWGSNAVGQLGVGNLVDRASPTIVSFFETDHFVVQVSLGATHTLALTASGRVFSWGLGTHGALGNSRSDNATFPSPIEITQLADKNIVQIVAGLNFNYARTSSNLWYSWGAGSGGVLGSQNDADILVPTLVAFTKSFSINNIYTTSTSRSVYGWMDPSAPTNVSVPELINECLQPGLIECKANAHCVDTDRSAICACDKGFTGSADDCKDIDECAANPCVFSNLCANTPGSYSCSCPPDRPVGDGHIDGSGCKTVPVTFPPTQAPTPSPTPKPAATTKSATSSSPAQSTTGASEQTSTGDSVTIATATTGSASGNDSSASSTGGPAPGSTASGSGTSGADNGDNGGSTTNGNSGSSTGDVVGSTTGRTNYYQTLGGVKDLDRIFDQSSEEDPGIKDPTDKASGNTDKDRDALIGVGVLFAILIVAALIVIVILYRRSRPPRY